MITVLIQEKLKNDKIEDHETLSKWFERIRMERRNTFLTDEEKVIASALAKRA